MFNFENNLWRIIANFRTDAILETLAIFAIRIQIRAAGRHIKSEISSITIVSV